MRRFGPEYLRSHTLSTVQAKAWRAILACRTPALGGQRWGCEGCGAQQWRWHSCRNRHCPQCQSRERDAWRRARLQELLDVPYCHLVFTLPHELNTLAAAHPRWAYETLMHSVAATLREFAANPRWLGGVPSFTLVLHTWTQDLRRHLHAHAVMACGALGDDGQWVSPRRSERFLFPVQALSRVFRGKFVQALQAATQAAALPRDALTPQQQQQRLQALRRHDWVVYAKAPLDGPAAVLDYLSRYTHRTAIGHERLLGIEGGAVRLRVRATGNAGGKRVIAVPGEQFVHRLMQHVLPLGFKRIRHYGLLAPAAKTRQLASARAALQMPPAHPLVQEQVREFMLRVARLDLARCPRCRSTRWRVVESLPCMVRALPAWPVVLGRGPP
nr:IS91 family transposase [Caldimonas mangrovi]